MPHRRDETVPVSAVAGRTLEWAHLPGDVVGLTDWTPRTITLDRLADALAWSRDLDEAADELWVSPELLRVRLAHMHASERATLRRRLEHHESLA